MVANKDFAVSVNKFFYYIHNYDMVAITYPTLFNGDKTEYLPSFFKAFEPSIVEHLLGKFRSFANKSGSASAIISLYAELDGKNRARLCKWINENYSQSEEFGINLAEVEA